MVHDPSLQEAVPEKGKEDALPPEQGEYCVVNFYHLVEVAEPLEEMELHRKWLAGRDVQGRIYISSQGINAQCGGSLADAGAYAEWVASLSTFQVRDRGECEHARPDRHSASRADHVCTRAAACTRIVEPCFPHSERSRLQGLRFTVWPAKGRMFPKLRLKFKPSLVSLAGGMTSLPVTDPSARATPLQPAAWKQMLADSQKTKTIVLDVRNDYEWDAGHFSHAARPSEEVFNETPVGDMEDDLPLALRDADPAAPIMMYCTGGIRCDIYSTFLKKRGFNNLYSLEGGVQGYLLAEGSKMWDGSLFVFDGRMALPADNPACLSSAAEACNLPAAIPCQVCNGATAQLPHINCANIDCNELFISCTACQTRLRGCCCEACLSAPRLLRPQKTEGYYSAWESYAEGEEAVGRMMASGRVQEGRLARRARRRDSLKGKRQGHLDERAAKKEMIRAASAEAEAYLAKLELGHTVAHTHQGEAHIVDSAMSAAASH
ncbi:MAG: hypothetical protein WDW38_005164 [Sanguina aurantia]